MPSDQSQEENLADQEYVGQHPPGIAHLPPDD
jgi:hypothetical protein